MKCNNCGSNFEGRFCSECGVRADFGTIQPTQQVSQSVYQRKVKAKKKKKTIFLIIFIVAVIVGVVAFANREKTEKVVWEDMVIGQMLPEAPGGKGRIWSNSSEELDVDINKITEVQYESYVQACKDNGFIIDAIKDSSSYKAYNSEGYKLYVSYSEYSEKLGIELNIPMEMTEIKWPMGVAGNQLPHPESKKGKFSYESDDSFFVYIGETSKDAYAEYVTACAEKGFIVDYDKSDNYYHAKNSGGWNLYLKYEGFNIMSIDIDAPTNYDEVYTTTEKKEETTKISSTTETTTETTTKATTTQVTTTEETEELVDGMRPEFKAAMDSYETFMMDYVDFMKKFEEDSSNLSILADYADYMKKYAEFVEDFDEWDDDEMNNAEMAYYIDVQARVSKKLLEIS